MNDLMLGNINTALTEVKPEYTTMLLNIDSKLPAIVRDTSNFYKSHSQFMQVTLDVTTLTPMRSVQQTLAEIEQTKAALKESYFNLRKKKLEMQRKQHELSQETDPFAYELLQIEIEEIAGQLESSQNYVNGAIRKMNFFVNQHDALMTKLGKESLTEEDYENEESRYHIMTCMKQALNAARTRGGVIDEGNFIYLFELGINAAQAQAETLAYLQLENQLIAEGKAPTHEMTVKWLEACADKWADCPREFAERRGFQILDTTSLANYVQIK